MQLIQKHKSILLILLVLVLIHLLHYFIIWISIQLNLSIFNQLLISSLSIPVVVGIGILYLLKHFKIQLSFFLKEVKPILIAYVVILAVLYFLFKISLDKSFFTELFYKKVIFIEFTNPFNFGINNSVSVLLAILYAPVFEEILYRKIIFLKLKEQYGLTFGIVVSAFIFALVHFSVEGMIAYFIAGLLYSYLYYLTKVLWLNVLVHFIHNLLASFTIIEMFDSSHRMYVIILLLYLISAAGIYMILKEVKMLTNTTN